MKIHELLESIEFPEDEALSVNIISTIAKQVFGQVYPQAKVIIDGNEWEDGSIEIKTSDNEFQLMMSCYAQEEEINVHIERAYSGRYKGVTGKIISQTIKQAIQEWGQPPNGVSLVPNEDTSNGYWQKLAVQLGVKYTPNSVG